LLEDSQNIQTIKMPILRARIATVMPFNEQVLYATYDESKITGFNDCRTSKTFNKTTQITEKDAEE